MNFKILIGTIMKGIEHKYCIHIQVSGMGWEPFWGPTCHWTWCGSGPIAEPSHEWEELSWSSIQLQSQFMPRKEKKIVLGLNTDKMQVSVESWHPKYQQVGDYVNVILFLMTKNIQCPGSISSWVFIPGQMQADR